MVLEVNRKLQLVLEDTLLKNMMQQDNIKMLGEEIDRQVGYSIDLGVTYARACFSTAPAAASLIGCIADSALRSSSPAKTPKSNNYCNYVPREI